MLKVLDADLVNLNLMFSGQQSPAMMRASGLEIRKSNKIPSPEGFESRNSKRLHYVPGSA